MNENDLYEMLRKVQEPKGYFFNKDTEFVLDLLRSLLVNKERYGHMSCPCRLATGVKEKDRDIICPCVYRSQDVEEYGSCFCGLYVSRDWNEGRKAKIYVPERRPPENTR